MVKVLALAVLAVVLIACGSGSPAEVDTPVSVTTAPPPTEAVAESSPVAPPDTGSTGLLEGSLGLVPDAPPAEIEVRFTTRAQVYQDTILIDVAADLPNGAVIRYEVVEGEDGTGPHQASGFMDVFKKHAAADVDVSDWTGPQARVYVAFRPWGEEQARRISQQFGEDGQRLVGSNISEEGSRKLIEYETVLRFPTLRVFQGQGSEVVGPFPLRSGVVTLYARHSGPSDLDVQFTSAETDTVVSLQGGSQYDGERAYALGEGKSHALDPGEYQLEVRAEGSWLLELHQEFPTGGFTFPISAEDLGDQVIRWLNLKEGNYLLRADHVGSGPFVVELISTSGGPDGRYIDAMGNFDGEVPIKIAVEPDQGVPPGIYALAIRADGPWHLSVE